MRPHTATPTATQAAAPADLAARLTDVTTLDERRLRGRLRGVRRISDTAKRERALADIDRQIATAQARMARRRAAVPTAAVPAGAAGLRAGRRPRRRDRREPGGHRGRGDRLREIDPAAEDLPADRPRRPRHDRPHPAAADRRHGRWPNGSPRRPAPSVGGAVGYAIRFGDHTGPDTLVKLMTDGILLNEIVRDRMLLGLRHDHHRRGPRAEPEHRFPARLSQGAAAPPAGPEVDHHLGHHRPAAVLPAFRRRPDRRGLRPHLSGRDPLPALTVWTTRRRSED